MTPQILGASVNNEAKIASGVLVTVTAADVVTTGLRNVISAGATLNSDLGDDPQFVSVVVNTDGTITIKTWKNTSGSDPTPLAATTFTKNVSWWAFGN
jgi:hypothetical protein